MLKVKEAKEELSKKTYRDIQVETAWKWASRAAASYENVLTCADDKKFATYLLAEEYYHEAVEHAALVPTLPEDELKKLQSEVIPYALKAWEELENVFGL